MCLSLSCYWGQGRGSTILCFRHLPKSQTQPGEDGSREGISRMKSVRSYNYKDTFTPDNKLKARALGPRLESQTCDIWAITEAGLRSISANRVRQKSIN